MPKEGNTQVRQRRKEKQSKRKPKRVEGGVRSPSFRLNLHPTPSSTTKMLSFHHLLQVSHPHRVVSIRGRRPRRARERRGVSVASELFRRRRIGEVHRWSPNVVRRLTSDHFDVESWRLQSGVGRLKSVEGRLSVVVLAGTRRLLESSEGGIVG